jgi:capsular polysaccharide transport system ATP-binding protein
MIELKNIVKHYPFLGSKRTVLDHVSLRVEKGEKLGILGCNGAGKSTLIRIISGATPPDSGIINRHMSVSWPLAFGGAFQGQLSGIDNMYFICRTYNKSVRDKIAFVEEFSELGPYLREPVASYSSGMQARLSFAISMIVEFDCYLIDEVMAAGDQRFHQKCHEELFGKRGDRAMVIVSHHEHFIRHHCHKAAVLVEGRLYHFDTIDEGYAFYLKQLKGPEHS